MTSFLFCYHCPISPDLSSDAFSSSIWRTAKPEALECLLILVVILEEMTGQLSYSPADIKRDGYV